MKNQINSLYPLIKESIKYLGWILLFLALWFKGCSGSTQEPQLVKVIVPEVKGSFEPKKPVHKELEKPSSRGQQKGETVYKENPIDKKLIAENEKLKTDFAKANDSIRQLLFSQAVQLNKFSTKFEDEHLILNIDGVVQGEVKEITPNYTIKKKKIEVAVKQKETVFRFLGGGAIGLDQATAKIAYRTDLGFQNKKGDIVSIEFLKIGSQNYGMVGFKKSIFSIKR